MRRASARWRDGSCRCWSGRARRSRRRHAGGRRGSQATRTRSASVFQAGVARFSAAGTPLCITMRRRTSAHVNVCERVWNEPRPNRRLRPLCGFVHRDIWLGRRSAATTSGSKAPSRPLPNAVQTLTRVATRRRRRVNPRTVRHLWISLWITGSRGRRASAVSAHCVFGAGGRGARLRHRDELRRLHHADADRRRDRDPVRHQHARAGDRRQPDLHVALARPDT